MKKPIAIIIFAAIQYGIMIYIMAAMSTPDLYFSPVMNVVNAIFYCITSYPLWLIICQWLSLFDNHGLLFIVQGLYCFLYVTVIYAIVSRIVYSIRRIK